MNSRRSTKTLGSAPIATASVRERPGDLARLLWRNLALEVPVDLGAISQAVGLDVEFADYPPSLAGCYIRMPSGAAFAVLNRVLPTGRVRFTCAHEIGHHLLTDGKTAVTLAGSAGHTADPEERTCDLFAANLLMPGRLVCSRWAVTAGKPLRNRLADLSEIFGVSRWTVLRRLEELELDR